MEDERHTERLYRKIDSFLKWTGLYRAAKGIAGVRHTVERSCCHERRS